MSPNLTSRRFKELRVGQQFQMNIGGTWATAYKHDEKTARVNKLNSPGTIDVPINPDLNEDEMRPLSI